MKLISLLNKQKRYRHEDALLNEIKSSFARGNVKNALQKTTAILHPVKSRYWNALYSENIDHLKYRDKYSIDAFKHVNMMDANGFTLGCGCPICRTKNDAYILKIKIDNLRKFRGIINKVRDLQDIYFSFNGIRGPLTRQQGILIGLSASEKIAMIEKYWNSIMDIQISDNSNLDKYFNNIIRKISSKGMAYLMQVCEVLKEKEVNLTQDYNQLIEILSDLSKITGLPVYKSSKLNNQQRDRGNVHTYLQSAENALRKLSTELRHDSQLNRGARLVTILAKRGNADTVFNILFAYLSKKEKTLKTDFIYNQLHKAVLVDPYCLQKLFVDKSMVSLILTEYYNAARDIMSSPTKIKK
jgi:hypothetical protein